MAQPISLFLIGGFLGAGKTTFLRRVLARTAENRVGLLVNELGSVSVDGALLRGGEIKLVEINNGSIFCACLKDGFVRTLKAFEEQPIDLLFIETSGMADPAGMPLILERLAPWLKRGYDYRGMVCLVDCTTFPDYVDQLLPVQNQVAAADLILLNKTDLVSEAQALEIQQTVRGLNEDAAVYRTTYADFPPELLGRELTSHGRAGVSSNTPRNRPAVYTLRTPPLDCGREGVRRFYEKAAPYTLRLKGFLETADGCLHVDGVCGQLELSPGAAPGLSGTLVAIGRSPEPFADALRAAWAEAFAAPVAIEEN